MTNNRGFYLALVLIGAAWGLTFPLSKIAVSTGYQPLGILVWQQAGTIILTGIFILLRRKSLKLQRRNLGLYFGVTMLGSVLSGFFSYTAASQLPAGIMAIVIALVPLFAMPIALVMGYEKPSLTRVLGLGFGAAAIVILMGPDASLPEPEKAIFVLVAMLATLAYGGEANFLEWAGRRHPGTLPDPFQILFGANVVGLLITLPLALTTGHFIDPTTPWGQPEWAILSVATLSTFAYSGYIWLIGYTGPIFASQVSYLVTAFGVAAAMLVLGESYSSWVWLALILILAGLFLVQPKGRDTDA
ncbi:MAG: DMT family transporter [Paracoccaceae bacterium]